MHTETEKIIKNLKFFSSCNQEFIEKLISQSKARDLPKGNLLFVNDDQAEYFYLVLSGWVKLFRENVDGAQSIIDILTTGHIFGETAIFQNDTYPYSAQTVEPVRLLTIPISILKDEIEHNQQFALGMMSSMALYRKQQEQEIENRTLKNAPQRIGCFLLRLVDQNNTGKTSIHLPYDKTLVASRLGMQPETFSRALGKLKNEINITIKGSTIEIDDFQDLVDYACSACSSEFPCQDLQNS